MSEPTGVLVVALASLFSRLLSLMFLALTVAAVVIDLTLSSCAWTFSVTSLFFTTAGKLQVTLPFTGWEQVTVLSAGVSDTNLAFVGSVSVIVALRMFWSLLFWT